MRTHLAIITTKGIKTTKNRTCQDKGKYENDVLLSNDTGILGKGNFEFSQQESNLRPSDY